MPFFTLGDIICSVGRASTHMISSGWAAWRSLSVAVRLLSSNEKAEWHKDLLAILRREVREGRPKVKREDWVERCEGNEMKRVEVRKLTSFEIFVMWERARKRDRNLHLVRSFILSQWRDFRIGVMWWNLWVLVTARSRVEDKLKSLLLFLFTLVCIHVCYLRTDISGIDQASLYILSHTHFAIIQFISFMPILFYLTCVCE